MLDRLTGLVNTFSSIPLSSKSYFQAPFSKIAPITTSGDCLSGHTYIITDESQLYEGINYPCLWDAGLVPKTVPLGMNHGKLLQFVGSSLPTLVTPFFYQGDFTMKTLCSGEYKDIGLLHFGGKTTSAGIWTIDSYPWPSGDGEFYDGKQGVLMDFSVDVAEHCGSDIPAYPLVNFTPAKTYGWPMRLFVDLLTYVGCNEADGGHLLLGRTWMLSPNGDNETREGYTVLWFVLKTFDPNVVPDGYTCGTPITVQNTFSYSYKGILPFLERLSNLWLRNPSQIVDGVVDYDWATDSTYLPYIVALTRRYFPGLSTAFPISTLLFN